MIAGRPDSVEYAPYFDRYVSLVPESDLAGALAEQLPATLALVRSIPEPLAGHRYAPDKWSIAQVLRHVIDTERVFGFRSFWFARNAGTALPGFEQDDFMKASPVEDTISGLAREFDHVRQGHVLFFESLDTAAWLRLGTASGNSFSVRALAAILVGHVRHHEAVLRERYLSG